MGPAPQMPSASMPPSAIPGAGATPYQAKVQSDGSIAAYIPSPDGNPANDIYIGVHKPFKVPPVLNPNAQGPQGAPMPPR